MTHRSKAVLNSCSIFINTFSWCQLSSQTKDLNSSWLDVLCSKLGVMQLNWQYWWYTHSLNYIEQRKKGTECSEQILPSWLCKTCFKKLKISVHRGRGWKQIRNGCDRQALRQHIWILLLLGSEQLRKNTVRWGRFVYTSTN